MTRTPKDRKIAARCIRLARSHGCNSLTAQATAKTLKSAYDIASDLYIESENENQSVNIRFAMMAIHTRLMSLLNDTRL